MLLRARAAARHLYGMRTLAFLPLLGVLLLPKCPLCLAAYLTAAGCGAAFANAVSPYVLDGTRLLAVAGAVLLALRLVMLLRRRAR